MFRVTPNVQRLELHNATAQVIRCIWKSTLLPLLEVFSYSTANTGLVIGEYRELVRRRSLKNVHIPAGAMEVLMEYEQDIFEGAIHTAHQAVLPDLALFRPQPRLPPLFLVELTVDYAATAPISASCDLPSVRRLTLVGSDRVLWQRKFNTPELTTLHLRAAGIQEGCSLVAVNTSHLWRSNTPQRGIGGVFIDAPKLSQLHVDSVVETLCVHAPWLERLSIESQRNLRALFVHAPALRDFRVRQAERLTTLIVASRCLEECYVYRTPSLTYCFLSSPMLRRARLKTARVQTLLAESDSLRHLAFEGATMLESIRLSCPALRSFRCPASPSVRSVSVAADAPLEPATRRHIQFLRLSTKEKAQLESGASREGASSVVSAVLAHFAQLTPDFVPCVATFLLTVPRSVIMYSSKRESERP